VLFGVIILFNCLYVNIYIKFWLGVFFFRVNYKEVLLEFEKGLYEKVHGVPIYEGIYSDPTLSNIFNEAITNLGTIEMKKIIEIYKGFEDISSLVDVGGGIGQNLNIIISKYPSIKGINFDLPHVIQNAPIYSGIFHSQTIIINMK